MFKEETINIKFLLISGVVLTLIVIGAFAAFDKLLTVPEPAGKVEDLSEDLYHKKMLRDGLEKDLARYNVMLDNFANLYEAEEEWLTLQVELGKLTEANGKLSTQIEALAKDIAGTEKAYGDHIVAYRNKVRSEAVGTKMAKLKTLSGVTYEKVRIKSVTALGLEITHTEGSCRVNYKDLPKELQERYQFDDDEALKRLKKERDHQRQRALDHAAEARIKAEEMRKLGEKREEKDRLEKQQNIIKLTAALNALDRQISETQSKVYSERGKSLSRAPYYQELLDDLKKRRVKLEATLMEAKLQN